MSELYKYNEEATRWRYVLAKVHHAWVREYKRQWHNNDSSINAKAKDSNNDTNNNNIAVVSATNETTIQTHEANDHSKTIALKSKAVVDKLKNKAVY